MGMLMGAVLMTVIVVGTAALSGHPLYMIAIGLAIGGAVFALTSRGRRLALRRRR
jgi:hypothetical protein